MGSHTLWVKQSDTSTLENTSSATEERNILRRGHFTLRKRTYHIKYLGKHVHIIHRGRHQQYCSQQTNVRKRKKLETPK